MNNRLRIGKSSELIVAGQLIRNGLDVYLPCVDDQAIDLVLRVEDSQGTRYYEVQVKSVKGYNRIVGVKDVENRDENYILVIHYRHDLKADEFFYLTRQQIIKHHKKGSEWGDLIFNKPQRQTYAGQTLGQLGEDIMHHRL